jgi:hypothetical protein
MIIIPQTNLPPHFRNGLLALEPFMAKHPGLCDNLQSLKVEDGHVTARIVKDGTSLYRDVQAIALAHRGLKWKRERHHANYSWLATEGDVTVVLPGAEPLEFSYELTVIDFDKISPQ